MYFRYFKIVYIILNIFNDFIPIAYILLICLNKFLFPQSKLLIDFRW